MSESARLHILERKVSAMKQDIEAILNTEAVKVVRLFTFYEDDGGKWRWRCKAPNGRTVAVSGESFHKKANSIRAANTEAAFYGAAAVVEEEPRKPRSKT